MRTVESRQPVWVSPSGASRNRKGHEGGVCARVCLPSFKARPARYNLGLQVLLIWSSNEISSSKLLVIVVIATSSNSSKLLVESSNRHGTLYLLSDF